MNRKYMNKREDEYKHSHIGITVVEASLIPSARDNNNELNKSTILGYVYRLLRLRSPAVGGWI